MPIRTKQWNEPIEAADGTRILISRYRPRGVAKSDETWAEWYADLGPSKELHAAAYGKGVMPVNWAVYRASYLREMKGQQELIAQLVQRVRNGETITLLCSSACTRESRCHRSLLKELIDAKVAQDSSASAT